MPLLTIDQGNSRTKCGLFAGGKLRHTWYAPTDKHADAADLAQLAFAEPSVPRSVRIGLCSVTPELLPRWQRMADDRGCELIVLTGLSPTPLRNAYQTPETLGPDRLLAAVAAAACAGMPVIPLSLGTATVVDAVSSDGAYLGGMIAPGIGMAAAALSASASALWPVEWRAPATAIGSSSDAAMTSGLFYQSVGGVRAMLQAVRAELAADAPAVLTGGWASCLAPYLDNVACVDASLVLRGIAICLGEAGE